MWGFKKTDSQPTLVSQIASPLTIFAMSLWEVAQEHLCEINKRCSFAIIFATFVRAYLLQGSKNLCLVSFLRLFVNAYQTKFPALTLRGSSQKSKTHMWKDCMWPYTWRFRWWPMCNGWTTRIKRYIPTVWPNDCDKRFCYCLMTIQQKGQIYCVVIKFCRDCL